MDHRIDHTHQPGPLGEGVDPVRPDEGDRLLEVWEASVRATHHFVSESDIQYFKSIVPRALMALPHLYAVRDRKGVLVAFLGVEPPRMEALFVHPFWHRAGVGRRLTRFAVEELGVTDLDVNEQNDGAVAFYTRLGFEVVGRSEQDGMGKPYPLLHMRLRREARPA